jgi:signal transduction histidine kinase
MNEGQITFETVDLNDLINQIIIAYQPRSDIDNLDLTFIPEQDLPLIKGARNQLAQVINNLLTNAFNYTPNGFIQLKTYQDKANERVVLEVSDSGIGIDPEDLPHLFDRFYRGRQAGQSDIPGTGLGLAIAKEIVDIHQGTIEVDCPQARGSTFRVKLPYSNQALNTVTSDT